jgi:hypothetical protein
LLITPYQNSSGRSSDEYIRLRERRSLEKIMHFRDYLIDGMRLLNDPNWTLSSTSQCLSSFGGRA